MSGANELSIPVVIQRTSSSGVYRETVTLIVEQSVVEKLLLRLLAQNAIVPGGFMP